MQHNHHNATKSPSADQIEEEINSGLQRLRLLIDELRQRIVYTFQPEKLLQQRWFWLVVISLYLFSKMYHLVKKMEKRYWLGIRINHHHWHHILLFPRKKF